MSQNVPSGPSKIREFFNTPAFKKWLPCVLIVLFSLAPMVYFVYNNSSRGESQYPTVQFVSQQPKQMVPGTEFHVQACRIIDGYIFEVILEGHRNWTEVHLKKVTIDEATPVVVEALKTSISPTVVLRRKVGDVWIVDFNVTFRDRRTTLLDWLEEKKLTL